MWPSSFGQNAEIVSYVPNYAKDIMEVKCEASATIDKMGYAAQDEYCEL